MDQIKVLTGVSILLIVVGLLLLGLSHGGAFNPVIPTSPKYPHIYPPREWGYHPERAYIDLTKEGPLAGIGAIILGGIGLVYVYAKRP